MRRRSFLQASLGAAALGASGMLLANGSRAMSDVSAKSLTGTQLTLRSAAIQDLAARMRGVVLVSGQDGYDSARRLWNAMFDRYPAVIARCASPTDVMHAVSFAREHQLLTAVRCGGHSMSGKSVCDGGIMIDLSMMQSVRVDPTLRVARVEGGSLLRHLDRETEAFNLVTTAGTVSHTGVGGLTLGGGFGRVARRFGLACDNVEAVDIVTADGRLLTANAWQNTDLLWAVRGGGGNFGVVTSFEFALHPMDPMILGGPIAWPYAQAKKVLDFYAEFSAKAPDALCLDLGIVPGADGTGMILIQTCWSGEKVAGEKCLQSLRAFGNPIFDRIGAMPYTALQSSGDESNAFGRRFYGKAGFLPEMNGRHVDELLAVSEQTIAAGVSIVMQQGGGAIGRVPVDASAFANRSARYWLMIAKGWQDAADDERYVGQVRSAWKRIEPLTEGFYINAVTDDEAKRIAGNYGTNYPRLSQLKRKYDPQNLFRLNANILPA